MRKMNKTIGYTLSAIAIVCGVLVFGFGIFLTTIFVSVGVFYLVIGVLLVMLGISSVSDIKGKE